MGFDLKYIALLYYHGQKILKPFQFNAVMLHALFFSWAGNDRELNYTQAVCVGCWKVLALWEQFFDTFFFP